MVNEIKKLWDKLTIVTGIMTYSCGGDSFDYAEFKFINQDDKEITNTVLEKYFDDEVFRNISFYEASDGYYIGEHGNVTIEWDEDSKDFTYTKNSMADYNEHDSEIIQLELSEDEINYIKEYVDNINGGDGEVIINFKKDFLMTDKLEEINESIEEKVNDSMENFTPTNFTEGDLDDWVRFTTNSEDEELTELRITGNKLHIIVNYSYTITKENDI